MGRSANHLSPFNISAASCKKGIAGSLSDFGTKVVLPHRLFNDKLSSCACQIAILILLILGLSPPHFIKTLWRFKKNLFNRVNIFFSKCHFVFLCFQDVSHRHEWPNRSVVPDLKKGTTLYPCQNFLSSVSHSLGQPRFSSGQDLSLSVKCCLVLLYVNKAMRLLLQSLSMQSDLRQVSALTVKVSIGQTMPWCPPEVKSIRRDFDISEYLW